MHKMLMVTMVASTRIREIGVGLHLPMHLRLGRRAVPATMTENIGRGNIVIRVVSMVGVIFITSIPNAIAGLQLPVLVSGGRRALIAIRAE